MSAEPGRYVAVRVCRITEDGKPLLMVDDPVSNEYALDIGEPYLVPMTMFQVRRFAGCLRRADREFGEDGETAWVFTGDYTRNAAGQVTHAKDIRTPEGQRVHGKVRLMEVAREQQRQQPRPPIAA